MIAAGSFTDPTVIVAIIGGFSGLAGIVLASLLSQRNQKAAATKIDEQAEKIDSIHVLVNSRMQEALDRIVALEKRYGLQAGAEIPPPG